MFLWMLFFKAVAATALIFQKNEYLRFLKGASVE